MQIEQNELYAGYASQAVRNHAASGGIVSTILVSLLDRGEIDGALVSRIGSEGGHIVAQTNLATTKDAILKHGGSSYIDTPVLQKIKELEDSEGRYAVVMLPCQVRAFDALAKRNPNLRETFSPIISLFCRGTVSAEFYEDYFKRIKVDPDNVDTIKVKREYVGGIVFVHQHQVDPVEIPFVRINSYRQAGFHAKRLCAWCTEHLGVTADISVGDIFMAEYRNRPIKHSAFVANTPTGQQVIQSLVDDETITGEVVGWEKYQQKFAKVEAMSNTLASRFQAARLVGLSRPRTLRKDGGKFNFFHMLAWMMIYTSGRLSRTRWGRRLIYLIPSPIIILYNFGIKALSNL